jgi:transposase-like protein
MSDTNRSTPREQKMFGIIEQYLASGMTQKAFCQENGVAPSTFVLWLKKYRQTQNPPVKSHLPAIRENASFIPLTAKPPETGALPSRYVIEFPNGVIVRLSGSVAPQLLVHLIQSTGG